MDPVHILYFPAPERGYSYSCGGLSANEEKKCIELYYSYIMSITSMVKCYYDQIFTS